MKRLFEKICFILIAILIISCKAKQSNPESEIQQDQSVAETQDQSVTETIEENQNTDEEEEPEQKYVFGNAIMNWDKFKETLPFINDDDVNIRKSPEILSDNVIGKFEKGDYLDVRLVTIEKDKIGGKSYPWYFIQGRDKQLTGWVYGQYVSVNEDYYMDVWDPRQVTIDFPKRTYYFDKLIEKSKSEFIDSNNKLIIQKDKMSNIGETGLWYLAESCPNSCTYTTDFGYAVIFYNESTRDWAPFQYVFSENKYCEIVGMTFEEMKNRLGNDFTESDGKITYFGYDFWSWWMEIELENNIVSKIKLTLMYD
ncbi:MAG: SH3 domain-containing protein [Treponema sp.]|nr:SH3 domain-containing protein [Treponema sp.]